MRRLAMLAALPLATLVVGVLLWLGGPVPAVAQQDTIVSSGACPVAAFTPLHPGRFCYRLDNNQLLVWNGSAWVVPLFSAGAGGSTATVPVSGRLCSSTTTQATTGTVKETLASCILPANSLEAAGRTLVVTAWGTTAANVNSKTFTIDFGGTTVCTVTTTASAAPISCRASVIRKASASQETTGLGAAGTAVNVTRTATTITDTANITLAITATTPTASADATFQGFVAEWLN